MDYSKLIWGACHLTWLTIIYYKPSWCVVHFIQYNAKNYDPHAHGDFMFICYIPQPDRLSNCSAIEHNIRLTIINRESGESLSWRHLIATLLMGQDKSAIIHSVIYTTIINFINHFVKNVFRTIFFFPYEGNVCVKKNFLPSYKSYHFGIFSRGQKIKESQCS